jgi:hypothetical protein
MSRPTRIQTVELQGRFIVRLELTDGRQKTVDLEKYLRGPIFESIRNNAAEFAKVHVDPRAGTIVWPNGADIDPDVLCDDLTPCYSCDESTPARS